MGQVRVRNYSSSSCDAHWLDWDQSPLGTSYPKPFVLSGCWKHQSSRRSTAEGPEFNIPEKTQTIQHPKNLHLRAARIKKIRPILCLKAKKSADTPTYRRTLSVCDMQDSWGFVQTQIPQYFPQNPLSYLYHVWGYRWAKHKTGKQTFLICGSCAVLSLW